jgi:hypothetical protein
MYVGGTPTEGNMETDFSRAGLLKFLDTMGSKGLGNANTVQSLKVACSKILVELSDAEESDVRKVDVGLAIKKFNNKNPGTLAPASLGEYQRRVTLAVREFEQYHGNPTGYRGIGGSRPRSAGQDGAEPSNGRRAKKGGQKAHRPADGAAPASTPTTSSAGLSFSFPLRSDFLAQLVVPRDMKPDEAKRLCVFVQALAVDG